MLIRTGPSAAKLPLIWHRNAPVPLETTHRFRFDWRSNRRAQLDCGRYGSRSVELAFDRHYDK